MRCLTVPRQTAENSLLLTGSHDPVIDYLTDMLAQAPCPAPVHERREFRGAPCLKKRRMPCGPHAPARTRRELQHGCLSKNISRRRRSISSALPNASRALSPARDCISPIFPAGQFINRQKGSGTRILLDYELERQGISSSALPGYEREATTHIAVALAVQKRGGGLPGCACTVPPARSGCRLSR